VNFRARIAAATRVLLGAKARYEGAFPSRNRTMVPAALTYPRVDSTAMVRAELQRKSRYFERNNGFYNRAVDLFEQYVVGQGLHLFPATANEPWNQRALAYWESWQPFADIASRQHWTTLQGLIARAWFVDGEVFLLKTYGSTGNPRVQLIEAHRCKTPAGVDTAGTMIHDGVEVDANGRPIAYWFETDDWKSASLAPRTSSQRVDADSVVHVFEPSRPGQLRGLPFCYPVLNALHDLDDLETFEMLAAKANASTTTIVKTAAGEVSDEDLARGTVTASDDTERTAYYRDVFGGTERVLKHGDDAQQFPGERPSERTAAYWDYLLNKFCVGVGIPRELILPTSMQGTSQRAMLDVAAAWFRVRCGVLADHCGRMYEHVISYGIERDGQLRGAPGDWRSFDFVPPKGPDVDVGRNTDAAIKEFKAGMTTLQELYGQKGQQWRRAITQRAAEAAFVEEAARAAGVEPARVLMLDPNEIASNNANQGNQP